MRKMLVVMAALLLAATSAQGGFVLSLVNNADGSNLAAPGTITVGMTLESDGADSVTFGMADYLGAQVALMPLPAGWSVSGLTYNTVEFDSVQIVSTNLASSFGIAADIGVITPEGTNGGYLAKKTLLTFTLVAPTVGELALAPEASSVIDAGFNTVTPGAGDLRLVSLIVPEPATALLLIGALPFLRRRRA